MEHLLKQNCTVVLDEFQRIATRVEDQVWLPEEFQRILDTLRHERADALDPGWRPRLIVMGSEQQKLTEIFEDLSSDALHSSAGKAAGRIVKAAGYTGESPPKMSEVR